MKKTIRVLQITESLASGGRESFVMNIYRNINRDQIQFDFFTLTESEEFFTKEVLELGGNIFSSNTLDHKPGVFRFLKKNYYLYKLIRKRKYSIVHIHANTPLDYMKVILAKILKVKIIMHAHGSYYKLDSKLKQFIVKIMRIFFSNIPDYCFACSIKAAQFMYDNKIIKSEKFKIVKNGVDVKKYLYSEKYRDYYRKKLDVDNKFVIGHIGRFSKEKNHEFIIKVYKKIFNKNKNTILLLVGEGELKEKIKELAKENELYKNVIFMPPTKDVYKLYQAMDIFWFPSFFESFGMVALEAQISGLKVLVSKGVPKSIELSNNIERLDIDENIWCHKTLIQMKAHKRSSSESNNLFDKYDVNNIVYFLQEIYSGGIECN